MYDAALAGQVRRLDRARLPARRPVRRRGARARRAGHAGPDRVGSRLPLVAQSRQPQHLAGAERLHGPAGPAARARRSSTTSSAAASSGRTSTGARTRAYAMGIGQIYFNLRGREAQGIVSPGAEARQLADELSAQAADDDRSGRRRRRSSAPSTSATTSIRASSCTTRRSCRSAWTTATASRGRRRSAARRRASSIRT